MDFAIICMNLIHGHKKTKKKVLETLTLFSRSHYKTKLQNLGQKYLNAHYLRSGFLDLPKFACIQYLDMTINR